MRDEEEEVATVVRLSVCAEANEGSNSKKNSVIILCFSIIFISY